MSSGGRCGGRVNSWGGCCELGGGLWYGRGGWVGGAGMDDVGFWDGG